MTRGIFDDQELTTRFNQGIGNIHGSRSIRNDLRIPELSEPAINTVDFQPKQYIEIIYSWQIVVIAPPNEGLPCHLHRELSWPCVRR